MNHLDLFSGIGGFAYAAQCVWKEDYNCVAFCEIDKFCQKVLRKHWPNTEIINDVKDGKLTEFRNIDLLTAGVPCQPASVAGKKGGVNDPRWLWPETLRIIRTVRPRFAILENVPGLFTLDDGYTFNGILSELAESGYVGWWEVIPACAVGAPHIRERIWIIAYAFDNGCSAQEQGIIPKAATEPKQDGTQHSTPRESNGTTGLWGSARPSGNAVMAGNARNSHGDIQRENATVCNRKESESSRSDVVSDAIGGGLPGFARRGTGQEFTDRPLESKPLIANANVAGLEGCAGASIQKRSDGFAGRNNDNPDTESTGLEGQESERQLREYDGLLTQCDGWDENWLEVATRLCVLDDGLSSGLVRPKGWRVNALKAGGNAIVPQVAMVIMEGIKKVMKWQQIQKQR